MASKDHLNKIGFSYEPKGEAIIEGDLGRLVTIELVEGVMLQIIGENGVFRIDVSEVELAHGLSRKKQEKK